MKQLCLVAVALLLIAGCVSTQKFEGQRAGSATEYTVLRIIDGDTLVAQRNGVNETVRVLGIDYPDITKDRMEKWTELGLSEQRTKACYAQGIEELEMFMIGLRVNLTTDPAEQDTDQYGRILRYVELGTAEQDLGAYLLLNGYAVQYDPTTPACHKCFSYTQLLTRQRTSGLGCLWKPVAIDIDCLRQKANQTCATSFNSSAIISAPDALVPASYFACASGQQNMSFTNEQLQECTLDAEVAQ